MPPAGLMCSLYTDTGLGGRGEDMVARTDWWSAALADRLTDVRSAVTR